jgi:hypothetical protein
LQVDRERLSFAGRGNISDLSSLIETEIEQDSKRFILRAKPPPTDLPTPQNIMARRRWATITVAAQERPNDITF